MTFRDLLSELDALSEYEAGPFPYTGCRWLQGVAGRDDPHGLIPDLDTYLSEFAGYRSWGKRIFDWPDDKIASVESRLSQSFFERFPAHAELKELLGSQSASDVRRALEAADQTRAVLARLFAAIRAIRSGSGQ